MKTRTAIGIAIGAVIGVSALVLMRVGEPNPPLRLARSWQLARQRAYRGMGVTDPFVSWSPDSRSLIFSGFGLKSRKDSIYKWDVGEKQLKFVVAGASPNYVGPDEFIYLKKEPKAIFRRSLKSGAESEIASPVTKSDLWKEVVAFSYDPDRKTIVLRLTDITRFYTPGTEEYDLNGKYIGSVATRLSEGIADYSSCNPDGARCALLVQEKETEPVTLQMAAKGKKRGRIVATGDLESVAWSPDGRVIAYADGKRVIAMDPEDDKQVTVGVFGDPDDAKDKRSIFRLSWSPNSQYLAVFVYVPSDSGDYPLYYVLDMSGFEWGK